MTTLEVAHELKVSKQTLLNWLYTRKVQEPPRNKKGYRLWSSARIKLVKRLISDGHLHKRTIVYKEALGSPEELLEYVREVHEFLRDAKIDLESFVKELARLNPGLTFKVHSPKSSSAGTR